MKKNHIYYISNNKNNQIHACIWLADQPEFILQISHGMNEYIERYENVARFFTNHRIIVAGNDHLGHGGSCSENNLGFMGEQAHIHMVEDVYYLSRYLARTFQLPLILLGHSMGSFIVRSYLQHRSDMIDKAFILGTGFYPPSLIKGLKIPMKILKFLKKPQNRPLSVQKLMNRMLNRKTSSYDFEWISYRKENRDSFRKDPLSNFFFTVDGYENLLSLVEDAHRTTTYTKVRKDLPICLLSGKDDPLLLNRNSLDGLQRKYQEQGVKHVITRQYPRMKHEILNETNREIVYQDILHHIKENL